MTSRKTTHKDVQMLSIGYRILAGFVFLIVTLSLVLATFLVAIGEIHRSEISVFSFPFILCAVAFIFLLYLTTPIAFSGYPPKGFLWAARRGGASEEKQ